MTRSPVGLLPLGSVFLGMVVMDEKVKVACLSVLTGLALTGGKLAVGLVTHAVSVLSEAAHSGLDLVAALIAYFSVRQSARPADEVHRYGHGKFENVAAVVEALLIIVAGVIIVLKAVPKLYGPAELQKLDMGLLVMAVSAMANLAVSNLLMRTAARTNSPALEADAWHLRTDVYTSAGVLVSLMVIRFTGWYILDPLVAIGIALLIFRAAFRLLQGSMESIVDVRLPEAEEKVIHTVLKDHAGKFVQFHSLRTRRAGPDRHIDFHLVVPGCWSVARVHDLCDVLESEICRRLPGASVLIHAEPCRPETGDCYLCRVHVSLDRCPHYQFGQDKGGES